MRNWGLHAKTLNSTEQNLPGASVHGVHGQGERKEGPSVEVGGCFHPEILSKRQGKCGWLGTMVVFSWRYSHRCLWVS